MLVTTRDVLSADGSKEALSSLLEVCNAHGDVFPKVPIKETAALLINREAPLAGIVPKQSGTTKGTL